MQSEQEPRFCPLSKATLQILGRRAGEVLKALKSDLGLAANLLFAEDSAQEGIKRFFEQAAVGSGTDYVRLVSGGFQAEFLNHYYF